MKIGVLSKSFLFHFSPLFHRWKQNGCWESSHHAQTAKIDHLHIATSMIVYMVQTERSSYHSWSIVKRVEKNRRVWEILVSMKCSYWQAPLENAGVHIFFLHNWSIQLILTTADPDHFESLNSFSVRASYNVKLQVWPAAAEFFHMTTSTIRGYWWRLTERFWLQHSY
jgi:hypothetical protein